MTRTARYVIAFLAVEILVSAIVIAVHHDQEQNALEVDLAEQRAAYDAILTGTRRLTDLAFDSRVVTPKNLRLFRHASSPDAEQAAVARGLLYRRLYPLSEDMKRNHVRQMHVHLPGGISFLRLHRPERFGDALYDYRPILKKVNDTRSPATGFETGRVTHGFRFAYPIIDDGQLLATFEFSMSFTARDPRGAQAHRRPAEHPLPIHRQARGGRAQAVRRAGDALSKQRGQPGLRGRGPGLVTAQRDQCQRAARAHSVTRSGNRRGQRHPAADGRR